jgi:hypothetical protein
MRYAKWLIAAGLIAATTGCVQTYYPSTAYSSGYYTPRSSYYTAPTYYTPSYYSAPSYYSTSPYYYSSSPNYYSRPGPSFTFSIP